MSRRPLVDEAFQGKLRNREEQRERQRKRDLKEIMDSPAGRRFMYDLLFGRCGLMNIYLAQDSGIYRHEGRRSVAVELGQELQTENATNYTKMIEEHLAELADDAVIRGAALAAVKEDDNA